MQNERNYYVDERPLLYHTGPSGHLFEETTSTASWRGEGAKMLRALGKALG